MNVEAQQLQQKITDHTAVVGIIGLGYVGLPLALAFTEKGFQVIGFDTDPIKVDKINRGDCYIKHLDPTRLTRALSTTGEGGGNSEFRIPTSEFDVKGPRLQATNDFSRLSEPDAVLICVPTPLGPHKEPDLQYVEASAEAIRETLRPGQLIILESTTYPGTTDDLLLPILEDCGEPRMAAGTAAPQTAPAPLVGQASRLPNERFEINDQPPNRGNEETSGGITGRADKSEIRNPKSEIAPGEGGGKSEIRNPKSEIAPGEGGGKSEIRNPKSEIAPGQGGGHSEFRIPNSEFMKCGEHFFLAFSPEREDPGNPTFGTTNVPKVVGGVDQISGDLAQALYDQIIDSTIRVASARVAEASKLTENIFRSVNIALVNELKIIYDRLGIDIWEVLDAAETKPFGFMRFNPGPGLGGHCIPLDPFYLAWRAREAGVPTRFIELAGEINTSMPGYVIEKLQAALNENGKAVKGAKILVLGLAYKPDIDDPRESPAFDIIERLLNLGAEVSYHDPHIPVAPKMRSWPNLPEMESTALSAETLNTVDGVILVTNHKAVDYDLVAKHAPLIIDTRGVYRDHDEKIHPA